MTVFCYLENILWKCIIDRSPTFFRHRRSLNHFRIWKVYVCQMSSRSVVELVENILLWHILLYLFPWATLWQHSHIFNYFFFIKKSALVKVLSFSSKFFIFWFYQHFLRFEIANEFIHSGFIQRYHSISTHWVIITQKTELHYCECAKLYRKLLHYYILSCANFDNCDRSQKIPNSTISQIVIL